MSKNNMKNGKINMIDRKECRTNKDKYVTKTSNKFILYTHYQFLPSIHPNGIHESGRKVGHQYNTKSTNACKCMNETMQSKSSHCCTTSTECWNKCTILLYQSRYLKIFKAMEWQSEEKFTKVNNRQYLQFKGLSRILLTS